MYDIGNPEQPNIQLAELKYGRYPWLPEGLRNPWTGENGGDMAYDEDSTVVHKFAALGAIILDPNRTMSLIPAVLAG